MDLLMKLRIKATAKHSPKKDLQLRFLKRLERLLRNGYPLIAALEKLQWNASMRHLSERISIDLKNGILLDEALTNVGFSDIITNHLYFIRMHGELIETLQKSIHMFEHHLKHTQKFQQVIRYPAILLGIFSLLLFFIKQSVLPSFLELFETSKESTMTLNISIIVINGLTYGFIACCLICIIFFIIWRINQRKFPIERQIIFYQHIPILNRLLRIQTSFLFASHFSTLLKTNLSMKQILQHLIHQQKFPIIAHYTTLMMNELEKGRYYVTTMSQFYFFEANLTHIFQHNQAEDMTTLEEDLSLYADILMEDLESKITKVISYTQPIFFTILACFIIFIYVTLMWPMFQLIQTM